ncbi:DUF4232 domain-containing protein [Nocardia sp. NPDC056000]|uniref:DUF4232 domain-containing protein n=1 Tax=Nocardia sp. NPDC056000 TaxID=3345674 RepID=UPI0035DECC82
MWAGCGKDPKPTGQSPIAAVDRCHSQDLAVQSHLVSITNDDPVIQHVIAELRLTNVAGRSCSIQGYPELRLRDKSVVALAVSVHHTGAPTRTVSLPSGALAVAVLAYDNPSGVPACSAAVGVMVTPPQETGELSAPIDYWGPLACGTNPIEVAPIAPAVYSTAPAVLSPLPSCRTADLTMTVRPDPGGTGMSHAGFAVDFTNHTEHDCLIAGTGPDLQLVDAGHQLQYRRTSTIAPPQSNPGPTVIPAGATGTMHGRYVDGPVCAIDGRETEQPTPTAYLRITLPDDQASLDLPFAAIVYCHGSFSANALTAD